MPGRSTAGVTHIRALIHCSLLLGLAAVPTSCRLGPADVPTTPAAAVADTEPDLEQLYADAIADPQRPSEDTKRDAIRRPLEYLRFCEVASGQHVLELGAGFGYTTHLFANVVGERGMVVAHAPPVWAEYPDPEWSVPRWSALRSRIHRDTRPWDQPAAPQFAPYDLVHAGFTYHAAAKHKADREQMNRAIWASLRPGGLYVVSDHHARPGTGDADASALHRIDAALVEHEILSAGFEFVARSDMLAHPTDDLESNAEERFWANPTHRFVLKFRRPR